MSEKLQDYKELHVWRLAVDLAVDVYAAVKVFPKEERYGLVDQMKRSSVSIASNIAEGSGRFSIKDFAHFLNISIGSACELETQLVIASRVGFVKDSSFESISQKAIRISSRPDHRVLRASGLVTTVPGLPGTVSTR